MLLHRRYLWFSALLDAMFLGIGFLLFTWVLPATKRVLLPQLWLPFTIFAATWLFVSLISGKFRDAPTKSLWQLVNGIIIADLTMLAMVILYLLIADVNKKIIFISLGTGAFTFAFEVTWAVYVYSRLRYIRDTGKGRFFRPILYPDEDEDDKAVGIKRRSKRQTAASLALEIKPFAVPEKEEDSIRNYLQVHHLTGYPDLLPFISGKLGHQLDVMDKHKLLINDTRTLFNIQNVEEGSCEMVINLHRINDIRRVNQFFIQVNADLATGGYFIGCAHTKESRKEEFLKRYPAFFGRIFYFNDFIIRRVLPKLPVFKEIYFFLTKGEDRIISKPEILGRLVFCGFDEVAQTHIDGMFWFIFRKVRRPREDTNPSYGPFVKMERVGQFGLIIPVYKFRTMHPFSEYLQDYIHKRHNLDDSGKFRNDFRITTWGKLFRKLWIDELPQLLNLYRGQLKLVGVRAISQHYFNLYPKDLQELRIRTKPGIIPPYYYDMPKSFDQICSSEKRYLLAYFKHPWRTDWRYFWKAVYNIVFKGARSK